MSTNTMRICPKCLAAIPADAPEGTCPKCLLNAGFETQAEADAPSPGGKVAALPIEELAKHFPQLEILELLGAGGMGMVYKARQITLDRVVALKILPPQAGNDPSFAERFTREARALAKLRHPSIVGIYDFGQAGGFFYFLMEYVDGVNLRQMLRANRLAPREALAIVPQVCDALQYAHDQGVVHRDIKPENLLVDRAGRVHIADFGLAKLVGNAGDQRLTQSQHVMGTPHYMAPEQFEKPLAVDHRADIYSLGVVLYEMLTGELPLGRFSPPSAKVQVDVRLDEVVLKTLEKEPERRYQQASEIKGDVETLGGVPMQHWPPNMRQMFGSEYVSPTKIGSWPLLHIAFGVDPKTGRSRTARGIIAIASGRATGVLALGSFARGVVAFGGVAVGVVAMGGAAAGVLTFGGLALALLFGYGGVAIAPLCYGGVAIGYGAVGGAAFGVFALGGFSMGMETKSAAREFFRQWPWLMNPGLIFVVLSLFVLANIGHFCGLLWLRRRSLTEGNARPYTPAAPRVSRKAIVGALWAPWAILWLLSFMLVRVVVSGTEPPEVPAWRQLAAGVVALFGLTAPIGTTALGLAAISDIRHSRGALIGLPLALIDALLFPLVILNGLCIALGNGLMRMLLKLMNVAHRLDNGELLLLGTVLGLAVALPLSVWIVRAAWRAAARPVSAGPSSRP